MEFLPAGDLVSGAEDRVAVESVADRTREGGEPLDEGNAGTEEGGERAVEAGEDRLAQDRSDDRDSEHRAVDGVLHRHRAFVEGVDAAPEKHGGHQVDRPVGAEALRDVDHHLGVGRKTLARSLEEFLEDGDDFDQEHNDDEHGDADDRDRIDHRLLDLALDVFGFFLVGSDFGEKGAHLSGDFARLDEIDVERFEILRVGAERLGKGGPRAHVGFELTHELAHAGVGVAGGDDRERCIERHAGLEKGRELAGEAGDVASPDAAPSAALSLGADPIDDDALAAEVGPDVALRGGGDASADPPPVRITPAPKKSLQGRTLRLRHGARGAGGARGGCGHDRCSSARPRRR